MLSGKSVFKAVDFGSTEGCRGIVNVVIKISKHEGHNNEQNIYTWLAESKIRPSYVPHLYLGGTYAGTVFNYLVLSGLGQDLERLRLSCPSKRFTPKTILAVAIQTVYNYSPLPLLAF
jgi:hypothetical protein